jgi:hypothetical protein
MLNMEKRGVCPPPPKPQQQHQKKTIPLIPKVKKQEVVRRHEDVLIEVDEDPVHSPLPKAMYNKPVYFDKTKILVWFNSVAIIVLFIFFVVYISGSNNNNVVVKDIPILTSTLDVLFRVEFILLALDQTITLDGFQHVHLVNFVAGSCSIINNDGITMLQYIVLDKKLGLLNVSTSDESLIGSKCRIILIK